MTRQLVVSAGAAWVLAGWLGSTPRAAQQPRTAATTAEADALFQTSSDCLACHNGLTTPAGEDVSIGVHWRSAMMANSSRDPYWHAAVRRETLDHPEHAAAIEDECSICHMPMARTRAHALGLAGRVFDNLPHTHGRNTLERQLAADGVSCTVCHQISDKGLGTPQSFVGGFALAGATEDGSRSIFGPFDVTDGHAAVMRSATGARPSQAAHIRRSEICATCHTLITQALDPDGTVVGSLPEQVPYQEWRHSAFVAEELGCQSCHMPLVDEPLRISSVLGEERVGMRRHTFVGGNFFMLRMLNRYRNDLGVTAESSELDSAARATVRQLQTNTATLTIARSARAGAAIEIDVSVVNLTGHKLPTGYPSRRGWIHLTVRDGQGQIVFESGRVATSGAIAGNDNDDDGARFEPHHEEIRRPDQVQIYESIMASPTGEITTGLLTASGFVKDNRLLPHGFDKATASDDIAVRGVALEDADFSAGGDGVRYVVELGGSTGPYQVEAELLYQTIGFRWAWNLKGYGAAEPQRFVGYYDAMSGASSVVLAAATARVE